ncbi:hypothetical protein RRG08_048525 [Elysia crispata]|uniref:Uncharacterized protein n=1 Tax=Elysia crispata TaxID=231223 RepID=A0AAE1EAR9_9GAST|nr:hypothetical protein RRG08_048525 [Elysia crispata]
MKFKAVVNEAPRRPITLRSSKPPRPAVPHRAVEGRAAAAATALTAIWLPAVLSPVFNLGVQPVLCELTARTVPVCRVHSHRDDQGYLLTGGHTARIMTNLKATTNFVTLVCVVLGLRISAHRMWHTIISDFRLHQGPVLSTSAAVLQILAAILRKKAENN